MLLLQKKKSDLEETEKALEALAELKDWKQQVQHVRSCMAWSDVYVAEAEQARLQNKLSMRIPAARTAVSTPNMCISSWTS